jgi:putative hydrolase of the HAD superfamily
MPPLRGVITDWGGVLTSPLNDAISSWITTEGLDSQHYLQVMRAWVTQAYAGAGTNPIHGLEDGSLDPAEFERMLAAELRTLDGGPVPAEGLLHRMFLAFLPVEPMYDALRAVRARGVRTALLSNSWGNSYPRELWVELFDAVVISAEVGLRKPDEAIYQHALDTLGLAAEECVFVDDIEHNVRAAEGLGMIGLHHTDVPATLARLEELLGVPLSG